MKRSLPVLLFFFLLVPAASATTRTWTGTTSGSWVLAANWGGTAPVANDDLLFPAAAGNLTNTNDFPANTAFNSITFTGAGYNLSGNLIIIGPGSISSSTGAVTIGIPFSIGSGVAVNVTGGTLTMNGSLVLNSGGTVFLSPTAGSGFWNGDISGIGTINKIGTGDWTLGGNNTFTGAINISAGRLIANSATCFGTADDTPANETVVNSGGTLALANFTYPTERITIDGSGQGGNGVLQTGGTSVLTGTVSLGAGTAMNVLVGQTITFNGILTGSGRFGMGGPGTYVLGNSGNNFSGGVLWGATGTSDSTLKLGVNNCLPDSVALTIPAAGIFNVNAMTETITSIAGAGTIDLGPVVLGHLTLTGGSTTFSGNIIDVGTVTQTGGVMLLTGANTYLGSYTNTGGTTTLSTGTLSPPYTQSAGGTFGLAGNGTVGAVNINGGIFQAISAGNSGNFTMAAAPATFQESIGGTLPTAFGNVHVNGTVNLGGSTLTLTGTGAGVVPGNTFTIIDNDLGDPVVGTFAGLSNGATIVGGPGGLNYTIAYNGGTGNDVVLTAAPAIAPTPALDPRALAALALVLAAIAVLFLRR